jgi:hypothetical protein
VFAGVTDLELVQQTISGGGLGSLDFLRNNQQAWFLASFVVILRVGF